MKTLKDWTKQIEDLPTMEITPLTELYTDMLATAHDIGYKVPDELLVETENPDELRKVIEPLDKGIKEFHAEAAKAKPAVVKKVTVAKKATITKAAPKKPAEPAVQKGKKEKTMAKAAKAAAEPKASRRRLCPRPRGLPDHT
jgi:hypothetical protein